jgi:hypothetical protein
MPSAQPAAPAWFAAKRPSRGRTRSPEDLSAAWRTPPGEDSMVAEPPAVSHEDGPGGAPGPGGQIAAGLPRRVPGARAYPGSQTPSSGMTVSAAGMQVLGAPVGEPADSPGGPSSADPHHGPRPSPRRSPEAARSRLSGFQLGSRDAARDGYESGVASHPGEENSR